MKTLPFRLLLSAALALVVVVPSGYAQRQVGKNKGPVAKIYVADAQGEGQIQNGDKIYTLRQATAFDAPGTVIETKAGSHNSIVYSNGTGLFVDESTRVEIESFVQQPFQPTGEETLDANHEPSMSQSNVFLAHGAVAICTTQLLSGSSMIYATPFGSVNIRGGKLTIESRGDETYIDLLQGDVTVHAGAHDVGGQILRAGERAVIRGSGPNAGITIQPIPDEAKQKDDLRVSSACAGRRSVTFEAIAYSHENSDGEAAGADDPTQQIVARPTIPSSPSGNIVISPDRLPGT
jgi:hypothetical protein